MEYIKDTSCVCLCVCPFVCAGLTEDISEMLWKEYAVKTLMTFIQRQENNKRNHKTSLVCVVNAV